MNPLSRRRRGRLAAAAVLTLALGATGATYAALTPTGTAEAAASSQQSALIEEGKKLYLNGCATCHGLNAEGSTDGPTLIGVGAAAVDFQVATGRMPLTQPGAQAPRKAPIYDQKQIEALAAYISSLGPGPLIPEQSKYAYESASVAEGGELFRTNCASCHNFAGAGAPLTDGKYAPTLTGVEPKHIYEAMLTGPQNMPVFDDNVMPPEKKQAIIAYIENLEETPDYGGLGLGRLGPVPEGLFSWTIGLGALIAASVWVAAATTKARSSSKAASHE